VEKDDGFSSMSESDGDDSDYGSDFYSDDDDDESDALSKSTQRTYRSKQSSRGRSNTKQSRSFSKPKGEGG
jgi:hypothetical protein